MKIAPEQEEMLYQDGRMDGQRDRYQEVKCYISKFCERASNDITDTNNQ